MSYQNSEANESNRFIYQFTDELNLQNHNKNMALANLSIYYTWKNITSEYNNNKFKILLQLGMTLLICLMSDNLPVRIYVNKIKSRTVFKIKRVYKLELLSQETMQLSRSSEKDIDQNKDGENVPKLETVEVVLMHCNLVNNNYQQPSKLLFNFVPKKQFGQLITITPHSSTILKTANAEFSFTELWFTDQKNRSLEIEDTVNITLIIGTR